MTKVGLEEEGQPGTACFETGEAVSALLQLGFNRSAIDKVIARLQRRPVLQS